jgi:hypothetical protein
MKFIIKGEESGYPMDFNKALDINPIEVAVYMIA